MAAGTGAAVMEAASVVVVEGEGLGLREGLVVNVAGVGVR